MASAKRKFEEDDSGKVEKKLKSTQKYRPLYTELYPCLIRSLKGDTYVHCNICNIYFLCAHGGQNDCKRHVRSKNHLDLVKLKSDNKTIKSYVSPPSTSSNDLLTTKAEVLMCQLVADLNLPIATVDRLCPALKNMFPDSNIAKGMRCGRNKATVVIQDMAKVTQKFLTERMLQCPYTISTDGSNDAVSKQYPIVVRAIDPEAMSVHSELLSVPICDESATGENIFNLISKELEVRQIPWKNCLSLGCDNASVMTGCKKGVYAFMQKEAPQIHLSGCSLHLIHIAARKAADSLPAVDELLVDIYYYFNKSDKRKSEFKGTQKLYDVEQRKILKHVCTRWLSISRCLERLLANWDPLKVYFSEKKRYLDEKKKSINIVSSGKNNVSRRNDKVSCANEKVSSGKEMVSTLKGKTDATEKDKSKKVSDVPCKSKTVESGKIEFEKTYMESTYAEKKIDSIYSFVRSPTNKLYCLFLQYTLQVFDEILITLQAEDPRVYMLRRCLVKLLRTLLVRFVKPSAMLYKPIEEVQYHAKCNIKCNSDLVIGESAKIFIENKSDNHLKASRIQEFYDAVVKFFQTACDYLLKKLPLDDPVLINAEVADVNLQTSAKATSLHYFLDRFPCLLPTQDVSVNKIMEQFATYQSYDVAGCVAERMDDTWGNISNIKDENGNETFKDLSYVMLGILTIPHSSAHCGRVFSQVRKNRTEQRASMGDKTLESLLVLKSRPDNKTRENYSPETLSRLKSSYYKSLKD